MPALRIDIVSDTVCPWCFVGKRRIERAMRARPDIDFAVAWHPFQLNPDMPRDGLDRKRYLEAKFGGPEGAAAIYDRIRAAGRSEGIAFDFDAIAVTPNTVDSHRLILWAQETGRQDAVVEALFRKYFFEGANIGDASVLAAVAIDCWLADDIGTRLASDEDRDVIAAASARMTEIGVTGVPCYIVERRYAVSGAQDPAVFNDLFDRVLAEIASTPAPIA